MATEQKKPLEIKLQELNSGNVRGGYSLRIRRPNDWSHNLTVSRSPLHNCQVFTIGGSLYFKNYTQEEFDYLMDTMTNVHNLKALLKEQGSVESMWGSYIFKSTVLIDTPDYCTKHVAKLFTNYKAKKRMKRSYINRTGTKLHMMLWDLADAKNHRLV